MPKMVEIEYACTRCGKEMPSNEYKKRRDDICPHCSGLVEENTTKIWCLADECHQLTGPFYAEDIRQAFADAKINGQTQIFHLKTLEWKTLEEWDLLKKTPPPEPESTTSKGPFAADNAPAANPLLIQCESCSHQFSARAEKCPKCGWCHSKAACQVCSRQIPKNSSDCPECGDPSPFGQPPIATAQKNDEAIRSGSDRKGFELLISGDLGLQKTFWLYGVATRVALSLLYKFASAVDLYFGSAILVILFLYDILMFIAVWRSATKYQGQKIWSALAKTTVVLGVALDAAAAIVIAGH